MYLQPVIQTIVVDVGLYVLLVVLEFVIKDALGLVFQALAKPQQILVVRLGVKQRQQRLLRLQQQQLQYHLALGHVVVHIALVLHVTMIVVIWVIQIV